MHPTTQRSLATLALSIALFFTACKKEEIPIPPPRASIDTLGGLTTIRNQFLKIKGVTNLTQPVYTWKLNGTEVANTSAYSFISNTEGSFEIIFIASQGSLAATDTVTIIVKKETTAYSKKIARVFEFSPAPGQFVNTMPAWEEGETAEQLTAKAEADLKAGNGIHLGGFGGYVIVGFDHVIVNTPDKPSFRVLGNGFNQWSEAGIIEVSVDANNNGLPDDEWYEIAGSEYNHTKTVKNYEITYHKPDENKTPAPSETNPFLTDTTYLKWTDNKGGSGYLTKNAFHSQSYYPQWKGTTITFKGTKLTSDNIVDLSGTGSYFISPAFDYGYADNWPNDDERSEIKLDWAVDKNGKPVKLGGIHFIKVYTGMQGEAGWLGEISTEVMGIEDLNLQ